MACDQRARAEPPRHDRMGPATRALELSSILIASTLLLANVARLWRAGGLLHWWAPLVLVAAGLGADFVSGLVHWFADTWFSETMPVLGRRFLRPFRVHHVNPLDFLRRDPIDTNGDVAMLTIPVLVAAVLVPLDTDLRHAAAVALVAFAGVALPTNQVHQWAHRPAPPAWVRWLQDRGVILGRDEHAGHHTAPHAVNYCIATGWCNGWLTRAGVFPALERIVTSVTGARPRSDEPGGAP
jgi:ubiquitin-conjugating enzyme E2 variant